MKKLKIKLKLLIKKLSPKLPKTPLNGWKVTKMPLLKNMNLKEKNLKQNSNQSWLNSTKDKVDKCQIWEIWEVDSTHNKEVETKVVRDLKLMKLIDFNVDYLIFC